MTRKSFFSISRWLLAATIVFGPVLGAANALCFAQSPVMSCACCPRQQPMEGCQLCCNHKPTNARQAGYVSHAPLAVLIYPALAGKRLGKLVLAATVLTDTQHKRYTKSDPPQFLSNHTFRL